MFCLRANQIGAELKLSEVTLVTKLRPELSSELLLKFYVEFLIIFVPVLDPPVKRKL